MAYPYAFSCPCCGFYTIDERGSFEICIICWWEDDGQSNLDAEKVRGGPNGKYSLADARRNFRQHGHMYNAGEGIDIVEHPSKERMALVTYILDHFRDEFTGDEETLSHLFDEERVHLNSDRRH